jgi:lambda family phage minor tail protein L
MAVPFSDLQEINPGAVIELFRLELNNDIHGTNTTYLFHAGSNLNANGALVWNSETYLRFPVEADGFEYSGTGQLPRPTIRIANLNGTITALLLTLPNGLEGAKVTRIRTLARYLDASNFPGNTNPYGTPDPTAEFPQEIFLVDRKAAETRDIVEFELAAAFDLAGVKAPKRQCIANLCQWIYKGDGCGYDPNPSATGTYNRKYLSSATYSQSGTTITVTSSSHGISSGEVVYLTRTREFTATYEQLAPSTNLQGVRNFRPTTYPLVVTKAGHGLSAGDEVELEFTSGDPIPNDGSFTITEVTSNTFTVIRNYTGTTDISGNVNVSMIRPANYYLVTSASTNTFTVSDNASRTESGSATVDWLKVSINSHQLEVGESAYFIFDTGDLASDHLVPATTTTNTMTFRVNDEITTSGNVTMTQWFEKNNDPTTVSASDACAKTLTACQLRFGEAAQLPFGGFPGIGAFR